MKNYFKGNKPVKVKIDICHDYIHIYSGIYQKPVKIKNSLCEDPNGLMNAISTFEELNGFKITGGSEL
ncbi:hypothetical protein [Bacillus sp. MUM 13]|uniref:hypothetical protein n=1 Tax=Bacillus sp. MUM 13 TaxID=1678001 RepID=UPI0008F5CF44|nr:hypothetical protein [Bacillus sp. MUM 13]OIK04295.1 hypothetical protein BIV59_22210 [Bacillus sp. MUM 13]